LVENRPAAAGFSRCGPENDASASGIMARREFASAVRAIRSGREV
jgi:hypothetical protein